MPPKNSKKRIYSKIALQDINEKKLENNPFNNIEKRFKKLDQEIINIQSKTCQTRNKTKLDFYSQIKLSQLQQEEPKIGFFKNF